MAKPFLTYDQQLDKLINGKKLCITDCEKSEKEILRDIGYFSLIGGYKTPFINPMTRVYEDNTALEDIYASTSLTWHYGNLCLNISQSERKLRQLISYSFVIYMERHRPLTLILQL